MRITHGVMVNSFLGDMDNNLNILNKLQRQANTGKLFSKPSDDPFRASRSMQLYAQINANEQYSKNIKDAINWADTTDTALNQTTKCVQRINELVVAAGNATYGTQEFLAIKEEINERVAEFGQVLNTTFDGKYIFGGKDGLVKPIKIDSTGGSNSIAINGDKALINQSLEVEISLGVKVEYTANAIELLEFSYKDESGNTSTMDVGAVFSDILNNLNSAAGQKQLLEKNLGEMQKVLDNTVAVRARVGTMQNRMDSSKKLNEAENFNLTEILSNNEDVDVVKKAMEIGAAQTVYMASLQTSSKVLQPTILDFIR
ncbi:flagellar hook-associated protein FlgL [Clostridium sp. UBA1056]|uniref:flagellar hook-associated protein FlgL n=1 Tax=unclassified Clostridium TaxID=2614128 RepID=UPI0032164D85